MRITVLISVVLVMFSSCKEPEKPAINKFSDEVFVKIADFQDRRLSDSLYRYFSHPNPAYRKAAVLAFASIQDTLAFPYLNEVLLSERDVSVRQAVALALGQLGMEASAKVLAKSIDYERSIKVMQELMEGYGRSTSHWQIQVRQRLPFTPDAVAWSYYRAGLKGVSDSVMNERAAEYLRPSYDASARLAAAHYFVRGARDYDRHANILIQSALRDSSADVRMASALALRKIRSGHTLEALRKILESESDYRVRVNAVKALVAFPYDDIRQHLVSALTDTNINVAIASSEILSSVLTEDSWEEIMPVLRVEQNWRVQANLYNAVMAATDQKELAEEVAAKVEETSNPYHKAALLSALQHSVMSFGFVEEQLFKADTPVVKMAAASALVAMNHHKNFTAALKPRFAEIYQKAIATGDVAVIATVADGLRDSTLGYKDIITDFSFLQEAKQKLSLPRDYEALQSLEATIAYFEGENESPTLKNQFNHPIDWTLVKSLPKDQRAIIQTTKGDITIQLLVEEAPGSVANFVSLANQDYYDQKFFHRVVPNFVVQAGCNRGDGFGSEDYSIRSEFSERRYKAGSVGMASAGKDTEGTQWFITHSPTPHLDGRYTLFAEVVEGMEVVHVLEVGDQILNVKLVK